MPVRPVRVRSLALAILLIAGLPRAAAADVPDGRWRVSGAVGGFHFELVCRLESGAGRIGGACVDGATSDASLPSGRSHPITAGSSAGDRVRWRYASRFLLTAFDVEFDGVRSGADMTGEVRAGGRTGAFTAHRISP